MPGLIHQTHSLATPDYLRIRGEFLAQRKLQPQISEPILVELGPVLPGIGCGYSKGQTFLGSVGIVGEHGSRD